MVRYGPGRLLPATVSPMDPGDPGRDPAAERLPPEPDAEALDAQESELRERIRKGASTPEELRALAEDLRAHREREQAVWRRTVKPGLGRAGRGSPEVRRALGWAVAALLAALVVLLAVVVGGWVLVVGLLVGLVAVAYVIGRRTG